MAWRAQGPRSYSWPRSARSEKQRHRPRAHPHPRPDPSNWPELPWPFLALEAGPVKFSCAAHGGPLEPVPCEPRVPATQREDSRRAQKAKALTRTKEPFSQECEWQPRAHPSESP